jgi:NADH dehydrogenase FAD-containing subunit
MFVDLAHFLQRPHRDYLKNETTSFLCGCVIRVTPYAVVLNSGEKISFDYLIIASGSHYTIPKSLLLENYNNVFVCNSSQTMRNCHNILMMLKYTSSICIFFLILVLMS